ncbi:AIPR family protein [Nonomuraea sp. NPDC049419]|uniref:AIPR family protein n=1 Tax=Nonomuraea sp. NPDC049419 TaxID=3155772 RepID=UPI003414B010
MAVPDNFIVRLRHEVAEYKDTFSLAQDGDAFARWALAFVHDLSGDDAYNQCDTLGKGDSGLDGYLLDPEAEIFYLSQSKFSADQSTLIDPEPLRVFVGILDMLQNPKACETRGQKIMQIGQAFREALASGCRPVLQYFIYGRISDESEREIRARASGHPLRPEVEFWTPEKFYREYLNKEESKDLEGTTIKLRMIENQYFVVDGPSVEGISSALVANLDGANLAEQAEGHMPRIVAANIRYHLGHQNRVNQQIRRTLDDETQRKGFWYYNNGITIVCDSFSVDPETSEIALTNPQIVNGCQTVTALINKRDKLGGAILPIAARIISRTPGELGTTQLLKIAEHTNSQSPVKQEDLKSNDPIQVRLQVYFANLPTPWFYERKRREWHSLSPAQRSRFTLARRITKEDVGQRWRAFDGHPAEAVSDKEEMFSPPLYGEIYREDRDVRLYLLAYVWYEDFWHLLDKPNEGIRVKLLPSFNERLLNRVLRCKKLWVMHCVFAMKVMLRQYYTEMDGEKADRIIDIMRKDPRQFDGGRKIVLRAFKQWADAIGDDTDMRVALKDVDAARKWEDNLLDHLEMYENISLPKLS